MKAKASMVTRYLLGLIFFVFGLNGLLLFTVGKGFIPMPPPKPEMATVFAGLMGMHYLMPLVKLLEVIAGLMLLSNRFVHLALVLLAPIVVNILGIHTFVDREGLPMALGVTALLVFQIYVHWPAFRHLVAMKD